MTHSHRLSRAQLVDRAEYCHEHDELTWVAAGSCTLLIDGRSWRIDGETALLIPAGLVHTVIPRPDSLVFPLIFREGLTSSRSPALIHRTPVLNACARVLLQTGLATPESIAEARSIVRDEVARLAETETPGLKLPLDPRARDVATMLLEHPANPFDLEQWARVVHTSSKTLQRYFRSETGMTFPEWRATARLNVARRRLERGDAVHEVAKGVGYATPSAFIGAFRQLYGITPGAYRDQVAVAR